jgi:hypothetical protein
MLTPEQRDLLRRHVSIDGNLVGRDNTVRVAKQTAGDFVIRKRKDQL